MYTVYQVALVANLPANAGDIRDIGSISGLGRFPEGGHGSPLWYSCLENPRDGGAWWAAIYGVAESRTRLKQLSSSSIVPVNYFIFTYGKVSLPQGSEPASGSLKKEKICVLKS